MAKTAGSKVVFVPMQLQSDVIGQLGASGSGVSHAVSSEAGTDMGGFGSAGRAGVINSISNI